MAPSNTSTRTLIKHGSTIPAFLNGGLAIILALVYLPSFLDFKHKESPPPASTFADTNKASASASS
jgi:hypothetical protein